MGLKDEISARFKTALKERDEAAKNALRGLKSAVQKEELDRGAELEDADILVLVQREVKRRNEAIEMYEGAHRSELVAQEQAEKAALELLLPAQLGEAEVRERARAVIKTLGATGPRDMGRVMKELMAELMGRADGKTVSAVVNELLKNQ